MNIEIQQLGDIYTELTSRFGNDPLIRISPTKGQPPEQYEIVYDLPCTVKDEDGGIRIGRGHRVSIAIPFGFPHFPPSCKPISPIFHPDFDTAAICLGDFWQHSHSLTELVYYIGTMLAGEVYSRHNAFNEEAAEWYRQHPDQLPFQQTDFHPAEPPFKESRESRQQGDTDHLELDVLEEEDLSAGVFGPTPPGSPAGMATKDNDSKSLPTNPTGDKLWFLARKKRFFQLRDELAALSPTDSVEGIEILHTQAETAIGEAEQLAEEAASHERLGTPEAALALYQTAIGLVADYADITAALKRLQAAPAGRGSSPGRGGRAGDKLPGAAPNGSSADQGKKPAKFEIGQFLSNHVVSVAIIGSLLGFLSISSYFFATYTTELSKAESLLSDCKQSMVKRNFTAAEKACLAAVDTAKGVLLFQSERSVMIKKAGEEILASETMQQGLRGNVLMNGSYVPIKSVQHQTDFQTARQAGEDFFTKSAWQKASDKLTEALAIVKAHPNLAVKDIKDVEQKLAFSQFRFVLEQAEQLYDRSLPGQALPLVMEARKKLKELPPDIEEEYALPLEELRSKCQFAELKVKTAALLANADWQKAYAISQEAIEIGQKLPTVGPQDLENLRTTMARAELYATIEAGNTAFSAEDWDLALERFRSASSQLASNDAEFSVEDLAKNRQKLDRIILQSTIIKLRQEAETAQAAKNIGQAIALLEDILGIIKDSKFNHDAEVEVIAEDTTKKLKPLQAEKEIADRIGYLTKNYKELFLKNYPETTEDRLSAPQVTFEKKIGSRLLFQMKCVDSDGGRRLTLVMFYTFDPASGSWSFYSET